MSIIAILHYDPSNKEPITLGDSLFLVNIHDNPDELENLVDKFPEKVKELHQEYNEWYKRMQ